MLNKLVNFKSSYSKNIATLISGTAAAQAITILSSPILTRLYSPEQFGDLALFISITAILTIASTGRYELAIMLPKRHSHAYLLFILSISLSSIFIFLLYCILFLFEQDIIDFVLSNKLADNIKWLYLIPISILVSAFFQSLNYWSNRHKVYKIMSLSKVIQSSVSVAISVAVVFAPFVSNFNGLVLGVLIGQVFATLLLVYLLYQEKKLKLQKVQWQMLWVIANKYKDFPKYLIFGHILNSVSFQSPIMLFSFLYSPVIAGYYLLVQRAIRGPMSIISRAIRDVYRQEASYSFAHKGSCHNIYIKTFKKLTIIAVVPFILFTIWAPDLFSIVFGDNWKEAGVYAQLLSPMFFLQFITVPLGITTIIAQKQKFDLLWQLILFASVIIAIYIGFILYNDPRISVLLFSVSYSIMYIVNFLATLQFSKGE